jgi:hypothetical protein
MPNRRDFCTSTLGAAAGVLISVLPQELFLDGQVQVILSIVIALLLGIIFGAIAPPDDPKERITMLSGIKCGFCAVALIVLIDVDLSQDLYLLSPTSMLQFGREILDLGLTSIMVGLFGYLGYRFIPTGRASSQTPTIEKT